MNRKNEMEKSEKVKDAIKTNLCVFCGKQATEFRNELSQEEFQISGLCQECQDKVFWDGT